MTLIAEHTETETRERILVVAERRFREVGYQKTTVGDIAKALHMSPANVYRFFDSKKSIHEGVARILMGEVEQAAIAIMKKPGPASVRLREMIKSIHEMNCERYVGDSKLHEMVEVAMQESWDVCVAHMKLVTETIGGGVAPGAGSGGFGVAARRRGAGVFLPLPCHDRLLPSANDRADDEQAGAEHRSDDRLRAGEFEEAEVIPPVLVIAGSEATKQSIVQQAEVW